ncbi:MAG: pyridoxal phosphate-dependent class II aminotransferase [Bacteroidales bacterium]|nr:pyridoxal phosphate-dependent class II aminotransferase [Bacteroidales bacterium]
MILGHGDDAFMFRRPIVANFSSNVFSRVNLEPLKAYLREKMDAIGHYPEPEPYTLESALADLHGINPAAVCATNGATEAIYLTAQAFAGGHSTIMQPTFSEYADACRIYGHAIHHCAADDLRDALDSRCPDERGRTTLWMCNPNNPTGGVIPRPELLSMIDTHPGTFFVIDQSYGFFTEEPLMTEAEAAGRPNVIQLHSMTKRYAMPGIRLGYAVGNPQLLSRIRAIRMPWSVNALAIEAGLYLCEHPETAPILLDSLLDETRRLREALNAIPGVEALPSRTHFFMFRMASGSAMELKIWLAETRGILIRDASNFEGLGEGCFRIATQTPQENDMLAAAIRQFMEERR